MIGLLSLRSRREYGEDEQPAGARVADTVRYTFRGDQQHSGSHRNVACCEQEKSLALYDVVDLVHACMRVECMLMPGLERIQADHHVLGPEDRALAHPVGRVDGVVAWLDRSRMVHGRDTSGNGTARVEANVRNKILLIPGSVDAPPLTGA